jgi:hypothetical protein
MAKKKKAIPRYYVDNIDTPVFKNKWNLIFCDDLLHALRDCEIFEDMVKHIFDGNEEATITYINNANALTLQIVPENYKVIALPKDVTPGVIAHEAFHLAHMILQEKEAPLGADTEEVYAHLIDWIVNEIHSLRDEMIKQEGAPA